MRAFRVYWFLVAALTDGHKLDNHNNNSRFLHSSGGPKFKIKVLAVRRFPERSKGKILPCVSQHLVAPGGPWPVDPHCGLCLSLHMALWLCLLRTLSLDAV